MTMVFKINKKKTVYIAIIFLALFYIGQNFRNEREMETKDLLLIDNLSHLSQNFEKELNELCEDYGYNLVVERDADVKYFKNLEGTYSLIILRLHSTNQNNVTWIFTNEPYKPNKYILEQLAGEVHSASVEYNSGVYYVISSYYIQHYLPSKINTDCVILMGCDGLITDDMADSWIKAGSSYYVGWDGNIPINKTDIYTKEIVENYLREGLEKGLVQNLKTNNYQVNESSLRLYYNKK